ncbi:hypothetical protein CE91St43_27800 [Oscillospiraceae bacterium]|nr:hypothetical protein CE91St43_27800 [Oscillospiraceae bacterium]
MRIDMIAMLKTKEEFFMAYKPCFRDMLFDEESLLIYGLRNTHHDAYEITNFLLDEGLSPKVKTKDGQTTLHLLFGRCDHDLEATIALTKRLLEGGADVNALDRNNESALVWLIHMGYTDEELTPLYDLWFQYPQKCLSTKSAWNITPIELAEKVPYRAKLLNRLKGCERTHRDGSLC